MIFALVYCTTGISGGHINPAVTFKRSYYKVASFQKFCWVTDVMARSPDKIKSIDGSKETLKLSVRISDLWFIGTPNKSEQAEMVFVDSDGDEIHAACEQDQLKLAELGIEARSGFKSHGEGSTQLSGSIQLSSKESFFGKAEAKTIAEINTISEEIVCVTVGTITRIVLDNHSWCYTACIQCHKKSDAEMAPFTCAHGKHNKEVVLRYRLKVMINEGNESTKFLLWDRECSQLIGQSADAVNKLKIEDGDVDLNASPQALDKLLGHELAFKIKVQPKFRNSAVLKCSTDSSLINVVMDMLADAETSSKMDIPVSDSNHSVQHESQSLSVIADHDPLLGLPLTPTKRQAFQDYDDEPGISQISPAQLSSNKLKKHA
ncbi:hypothetical protein JHK82_028029 [Glycine max]|nr:hypothetical protein JHK82_028029 [Glycine max]